MALLWVRLDTAFPRNPKVLALLEEKDGYRAAFVWLASLAYCGEQGTDGFIPRSALPHIHGRPSDAEKLTRHRLWSDRAGAGWGLDGWAEFQQSTAESQARGARAQQASRKANCVRWHGQGCGCWQDP